MVGDKVRQKGLLPSLQLWKESLLWISVSRSTTTVRFASIWAPPSISQLSAWGILLPGSSVIQHRGALGRRGGENCLPELE